jgi:transcription elongation GreA/GreB family factor
LAFTKLDIINHLIQVLDSRIAEIKTAIASAKEARDTESKSSAGDKYETGRAMAQIELDKLQQQLQHNLSLKTELLKIDPLTVNHAVGFGTLVKTNTGNYFIAVALGKIILDQEPFYAISLASPIGQALKQAKTGDKVTFNGSTIEILSIDPTDP